MKLTDYLFVFLVCAFDIHFPNKDPLFQHFLLHFNFINGNVEFTCYQTILSKRRRIKTEKLNKSALLDALSIYNLEIAREIKSNTRIMIIMI